MQCKNTSFEADSLMEHLKKHSEAKSNKCSLCDFASSQASNMRRHLITHTGGKSNKCVQCEYQYSQAGNLWEKAKQCNQCQYTSIRANSFYQKKVYNFTRRMKVKVYNLVRQIIYWWRIIYWCLVYHISGANYLNFRHFTIRHILLTLQA